MVLHADDCKLKAKNSNDFASLLAEQEQMSPRCN